MKRMRIVAIVLPVLLAASAACGDGGGEEQTVSNTPPVVTFEADDGLGLASKPGGPVTIAYRVIGVPVVGQPVTVDLEITSNVGKRPVTVNYRTTDTTALTFPESQAASVPVALDDERPLAQQVTVIPMREGRTYLNVAAEIETESGSLQTVTAIPIEVSPAPREREENGTLTTGEDGELIRSLPAEES